MLNERMSSLRGLKAVSLLRASTAKQTTDDNDIPYQRDIVNNFIEKNGMLLIREFVEGGVSGFKIKMENRDAVQRIKGMADRKEFDILVVYYSDRIGRTSDESPLVISYLNERNIIVVSVNEGIISTKSQVDKLLTYIRFWTNENESIKISNRSTDYQTILIKEGRYRGGGKKMLAYGYRLVDNRSKNLKGRYILDVEIDPETSKIVILIYDFSINYNMGARAIASYLNEHHRDIAKNPSGWSYRSVTYILNNPVYKGVIRMFSRATEEEIVCPEIKESLVIIPEAVWEKNQQVIKGRITTSRKPRMGITSARVLLSGLVYCGHCQSKMVVYANYRHRNNKNGTRKDYIKDTYMCTSRNTKMVECSGQTTYSAARIDRIVEKQTIDFVREMSEKSLTEDYRKQLQQSIDDLICRKKQKEDELIKLQSKIQRGKEEILKALDGESQFTPQEIRESIDMAQKKVDSLLKELSLLDDNIIQAKITLNEHLSFDSGIKQWEENYRNGDMAKKKSLMGQIIEKVILTKDKITIQYTLTANNFLKNSDEWDSNKLPLGRAHGSGP